MRTGPYSSKITTSSRCSLCSPFKSSVKLLPGSPVGCLSESSRQLKDRREQIAGAYHFAADGIGRNVPRPGNQKRHLNCGIIHIHRECPVALPPDAVLSHAHSVVRCKEDHGIACQPLFFYCIQQFADLFIHRTDRRKIAPQIFFPLTGSIYRAGAQIGMIRHVGNAWKRAATIVIDPTLQDGAPFPRVNGVQYSGQTDRTGRLLRPALLNIPVHDP